MADDKKGIGARLREAGANVKGAPGRAKESFSSKKGFKDMVRRVGAAGAMGAGAGGALGAGIGSTMRMKATKDRADAQKKKRKSKVPGADRPSQTYSND